MNSARVRPLFRSFWRVLLCAWAGIWAFVVLAIGYGGKEAPPPWWIPSVWLAGLAVLVALGWRWMRLGGLALLTVGVLCAIYFGHPAARALLAAPAIALGLTGLVLRGKAPAS